MLWWQLAHHDRQATKENSSTQDDCHQGEKGPWRAVSETQDQSDGKGGCSEQDVRRQGLHLGGPKQQAMGLQLRNLPNLGTPSIQP